MRGNQNRWFPGQRSRALQFGDGGWVLETGRRWDAEQLGGEVRLRHLEVVPPDILHLDFVVDGGESWRVEFRGITDLQVDGDFSVGATIQGWRVVGTTMLVSTSGRADGRLVYDLELPNAMVVVASLPAVTTRIGGSDPRPSPMSP